MESGQNQNPVLAIDRSVLLKRLFFCFLRIGAFTFGGGYAMLPLIRKDVVEQCCWLQDDEFMDIIGVVQMAPGAVAINCAIFIGYKLARLPGALTAAIGVVLPSFGIILLIATAFSHFQEVAAVQAFFQGVRPAITVLIAVAAYKMGLITLTTRFNLGLALAAFAGMYGLGLHPIAVLLAGGAAGFAGSRLFPPAAGGR